MYLDILWNSFSSNIILATHSEQFLYAMAVFGGYALTLPFLATIAGATGAHLAHYLFGYYVLHVSQERIRVLTSEQYQLMHQHFRKYGIWLLILFPIPFYGLIPMLCGFFRLPLAQVMLLAAVAQVLEKGNTVQSLLQWRVALPF